MTDDYEIVEFDTTKEFPHGITDVTIHMSRIVHRDEKKVSWMPQYRPCMVVYCRDRHGCFETSIEFGLKNIDACLVVIGKGIVVNFCGYGADTVVHIENISRIVGKRSKYNSAEQDFNTGRIVVELKEAGGGRG